MEKGLCDSRMEINIMNGKKTYTVMIAGLMTAVGGFMSGDMSLTQALVLALNSLGLGALRHGISTRAGGAS